MNRSLKKLGALLCLLAFVLTGCGSPSQENKVTPLSLSQDQKELLGYLGLNNTAMFYTLQTPENALSLSVNCYALQDGQWADNGGGSISWDSPDAQGPQDPVVSLVYREDRTFDVAIHAQGTSSFRSKPVESSGDLMSFSQAWLTEDREIQLDQEIPVALFVGDDGTSLRSFTVDSFFTPEEFQDYAMVQAVTFTFSAQE